jgi:mannosyltransferase OCH1-like enzyme
MSNYNTIESFTNLLKDTYTFDKAIYNNDKGWQVLRYLYNHNFIFADKSIPRIPKKIHQIWLGSPVPEKYKDWMESWKQFNPDWEYRLWTDKDLTEDQIHITDWDIFNEIGNMGQKADYLRYHILNQFGGLYVDTDFECLAPFDSLRYAKFLAGITYDKNPIVNIAIIGGIPHHPIIERVLRTMEVKPGDSSKHVFNTTGPYFFTKCFFEEVGEYMEGVVVLAPQYFYPFPNEKGFQERNGKDYIKECSYAIHYWDISWIKKN